VLHYALLGLTSVTAVGAFDAVGAILVIAFLIVPASAAYLLTDDLRMMMLLSMAIAVASSVLGYYIAVDLDVSISGMMATVTGGFLAVSFLLSPRYGMVARQVRMRRQRDEHAERLLVVHLSHHEDQGAAEECRYEALETHLRWTRRRARQVVERSQARGLIELSEDRSGLRLTERGRQSALAALRSR
jgi:manganese/zinc/iron transport system permease protein